MANAILSAINHGFTSAQVLRHISQQFPRFSSAINTAQAAGYATDKILKKLAKPDESADDSDEYLTEHERTQKRDSQQKKKAALQVAGILGTAGAVGAGAYSLAQRNRPIKPQVLPALPGQGPQARGGGMAPRGGPPGGLPGGGRPGLPAPRQGLPAPQAQQPRGRQPSPAQPPIPMAGPKPEDQLPQVPEVRNLQRKGSEINQMWDLAQKGKTQGNPFLKTASKLQKAGTITDVVNFANFYNWWNATEGQPRSNPLVEYEKFRVQTKGMFEPPTETAQLDQQRIQDVNLEPRQQPEEMQQPETMQQPELAPEEQMQPMAPQMSVRERTQQAAFAERPELKRLIDTSFKGKEFAIPTYKFPGESQEDFSNRRIINEAVKKAAGELKKGKSFLDFGTIPPEVLGVGGLSTAEDVLRFMAGIPNVYDPLLDEEEKQDLYDGLLETGQATQEGLRPSEGPRGAHGAPMSPNMVWNLLLTVEPRLYKMERPKAMKGAVKPGEKMDSTGFRRYLTHAVYGVLSGKNIGPDLSEKIAKISQATAQCKSIAQAAEDGKFKKMMNEIERLTKDDAAFFALFDDEVENMVAQYGIKGMEIKGSAADTRYANELENKLRKKEKIPIGEHGD